MCPAGAVWGSGRRTPAGDAHWVNLAWGAATRWPVGFGARDSPPRLVDVRRGQKLLWAGGGAPGVGWLVAAAGAKGALVTSGRSPSLSGELQTSTSPHPPEIFGGRSGRPDTPAPVSWGRWVFYLVTL